MGADALTSAAARGRPINWPLVAAAATGVQVGAAIVASRFAVAEVPPLTLAMLRYAVGLACLLPFAWRELARPATATAAPPVTGRRAAALGHERITSRLLAGVLLSIAGVAVALAPKLGAAAGSHWWGELAVVGAALTGAVCSVLYRPYLRRYPTVPVSAFAMLASVLFLAVLAAGEHWPQRLAGVSTLAWAAVVFIGVSSGVGYFWWLYALKHESPTRVTVFLALNPVTAALLGWALLGEPLHPAALAALTMIGIALWLATHGPSAARAGSDGIGAPR